MIKVHVSQGVDPNIVSRLQSVISEMLDVTNFELSEVGDLRFWINRLLGTIVQFHYEQEQLANPNFPSGSMAKLKRLFRSIQDVRGNVDQPSQQFELGSPKNGLPGICQLQSKPVLDAIGAFFERPLGVFPPDPLCFSAIVVGFQLAAVRRGQMIDRQTSPKKNLAKGLIEAYLFANPDNHATSSPSSPFAHFFSLAYYVATGLEGEFLEGSVKRAIRNMTSDDGDWLSPAEQEARILGEESGIEPDDQMSEKEWYGAISRHFDDLSNRQTYEDIVWMKAELPFFKDYDFRHLDVLAEGALRKLHNPTEKEKEALSGLKETRTTPPNKTD